LLINGVFGRINCFEPLSAGIPPCHVEHPELLARWDLARGGGAPPVESLRLVRGRPFGVIIMISFI